MIPGLSARALAEVARIERDRPGFQPGKGYDAYRAWLAVAELPGNVVYFGTPVGCGYDEEHVYYYADGWRDVLETLVCGLSPPSERELRGVLAPLDERLRRRTLPDPAAPPAPDAYWWRRRLRKP